MCNQPAERTLSPTEVCSELRHRHGVRRHPEQIRKLCRMGLIPGAFRMPGVKTHWEIPAGAVDQIIRRAE